jgi:SHOCT-like domain
MSEETQKILEMLSAGKVSVQEAEQLLQAVGENGANGASRGDAPGAPPANPRYFRITVNKPPHDGKKAETVNIKVPMTVVRGGLRLSALFPGMLGKKKIQLSDGNEIDLSKVHYEDLEAMIKDIGELTVDVDGDAQVRIRCE